LPSGTSTDPSDQVQFATDGKRTLPDGSLTAHLGAEQGYHPSRLGKEGSSGETLACLPDSPAK